jgi:arginyl-tRNA synthetase
VRASNIFRKAGLDPDAFALSLRTNLSAANFSRFLEGPTGTEIWELWLAAARTSSVVEQCVVTTEPAYAAKHAFQLAQLFNNFYHRHHILSEADEERKACLLATVGVVRRELIRILAVMGISVPPVM